MNIITLAVLSVVAAVIALMLRKTNPEIALLLIAAAALIALAAVINRVSPVISQVSEIAAASNLNTAYIAVLLKVIGICLLSEFTANICRDAGSQSLAGNVTLAGKLAVTVCALPLYTDIFNTAVSLLRR